MFRSRGLFALCMQFRTGADKVQMFADITDVCSFLLLQHGTEMPQYMRMCHSHCCSTHQCFRGFAVLNLSACSMSIGRAKSYTQKPCLQHTCGLQKDSGGREHWGLQIVPEPQTLEHGWQLQAHITILAWICTADMGICRQCLWPDQQCRQLSVVHSVRDSSLREATYS